jgi:hypothetical protein
MVFGDHGLGCGAPSPLNPEESEVPRRKQGGHIVKGDKNLLKKKVSFPMESK